MIGEAPGRAHYGDVARLRLSAGDAARAVLVAPAAVTHAADMNQRHVELEIAGASGESVDVRLPADAALAPPGYYMLFVIDAAGTPSVARWIQLVAPPASAPAPAPARRDRDAGCAPRPAARPGARATSPRRGSGSAGCGRPGPAAPCGCASAPTSARGSRPCCASAGTGSGAWSRVRGGRPRTVAIKLPKAVARRLRSGRRVSATLRLLAEDAAGNRSTVRRSAAPELTLSGRIRGSRRAIATSASRESVTISTAAHSASACSVGMSIVGRPAGRLTERPLHVPEEARARRTRTRPAPCS